MKNLIHSVASRLFGTVQHYLQVDKFNGEQIVYPYSSKEVAIADSMDIWQDNKVEGISLIASNFDYRKQGKLFSVFNEVTKLEEPTYEITELNDELQEYAHGEYLLTELSDFWNDENAQSLEEFIDAFPIPASWDVGDVLNKLTVEDEIAELTGLRLRTYLINNYNHILTKGKYYSLWSKKDQNPHWTPNNHAPWGDLKSRRSRITMVEGDFNGYYMDYILLQPIQDFIKHPNSTDFTQLMYECLQSYEIAKEEDREHQRSMEYFVEMCEGNEWKFDRFGALA